MTSNRTGILLALLALVVVSAGFGAFSTTEFSRDWSNGSQTSSPLIHSQVKSPRSEPAGTCAKPNSNSQSELCAQWVSAHAAVASAYWSEKTYYLTVAGTFGVISALLVALWSNRIALRAVDAESRPWLHPVSLTCEPFLEVSNDPSSGVLFAQLVLNNVGRTAATNISIGAILVDDVVEKGFRFWREPMPTIWVDNVLPGTSMDVPLSLIFPIRVADSFGASRLALRIRYKAPNQIRVRKVHQFWTLARSVYRNTPVGADEQMIAEGLAPIAKLMFTIQMT